MQIKDAAGNVIAEVDIKDGFSLQELVKSLSNKKSQKSSFSSLKSIEESGDKKQIVFKFSDGEIFYDLPKKLFTRSNGSLINENSFRSIKLDLDNKIVKRDRSWWTVDTFWLKVSEKTEVPWIKTFFKIIDIWANKKYTGGHCLYVRERQKRNKLKSLIENKKFFDSVETFSKIEYIQNLNDNSLESFYGSLLEIFQNKHRNYNRDADAIDFNVKIDSWLLKNIGRPVSEVYVDPDETLADYIGDYIKCSSNGLRDSFQYVFETYGGVILDKQINHLKDLINRYKYENKRLMDYLYRDIYNQGLSLELDNSWGGNGALSLLHDYVKMSVDMRREYEKYPRYLSTFHDITTKNYKLEEDKIANEKFAKVIKRLSKKKYEYSGDDYSIILPKDGKSLMIEGQSLSHCVASYYKRMAQGATTIVFLRKTKDLKNSLVTLEVVENEGKAHLIQAKGKNNSQPGAEEMKFINKYIEYLNNDR